MPATVNANLLRIASMFISTEVTRYYLQGVLIQRHQLKGVNLVATDGHRMIVIWDENGHTSLDDVIVRLDKATLAACKPVKGEHLDRIARIDGDGVLSVLSGDEKPVPVSISYQAIIDGTFPHWQRVVPNMAREAGIPTFNPKYVTDFCKVATELCASKTGALSIAGSADSPALIRFQGVQHVFGVLMPIRNNEDVGALPSFLNAEQEQPTFQEAAE